MRRLLVINNVPSHYRAFMFNKMSERGRERGVEVTVAFQAEREPHRPWSPEQFDMRFPYFISTGLNPWSPRRRKTFTSRTINTDIIGAVMFGAYDWVLMAPFMSMGNWAAALLPCGRTRKLLWSESNVTSARYVRGPVRSFKSLLQSPFAALVCPGQRAADYVRRISPGLASRPVLWLPNIVDTSLYDRRVREHRERRRDIRAELGVHDDEVLVVAVGQMIERKGFHRLIEAAARVEGAYHLVLLGDGPLREAWSARIATLGASGRIRLPGAAEPTEVARHLAAADWFVHPALHDPSPLVVVEATVAGLPMAVSTQTGNAPEAVVDGENGFTFDAREPDAVAAALRRMVDGSAEERRSMSRRSVEVAHERFDPDVVVERFFRDLLGLDAGRPAAGPRRGSIA